MVNEAEDTSVIFGVPFAGFGIDGIAFKDITTAEGLDDEDQIQVAYTDERGITQMYGYVYFGEWLNEDMDPVADDEGVGQGQSAWFISSGDAKHLTTAGQVAKDNFVHTFTETSALVSSAFPVPFCPNSENVSWGVSDETQIQTAFTDERGITQMYGYVYFGEWLNEDMDSVPADEAIVGVGEGFWLILVDADETFAEVSPIAE